MVDSIQQMASAMKLDTIAECVEDEQTLNILREIGIDYAQGYHLGRPQAIREGDREQLIANGKQ
jgi:Amt family ammonium transporter